MKTEEMVLAVRDYIDKNSWNYEYIAEKQLIRMAFNIKSKIQKVRIIWDFNETAYMVLSIAHISCAKENLAEMFKFLAMVNYTLIDGNFQIDYRDGEIRYKTFVNCNGHDKLPEEVIDRSLDIVIFMMERYGDSIAAIAMGFSDADTEFKKIIEAEKE